MEKKWIDHVSRIDLMCIDYLNQSNWTPVFNYKDIISKRTTPANPPMFLVSFYTIVNQRNVVELWKTKYNWVYALKVNGSYIGHTNIDNPVNIVDVNINKFVEDNNVL